MRFSVFGPDGELLATNEYFRYMRMSYCLELIHTYAIFGSVGGGFVVNEKTKGWFDSLAI